MLDRLVVDFLNVVKEKYSGRYYHLQITESKSKSIFSVISKKKVVLWSRKRGDFLKTFKK